MMVIREKVIKGLECCTQHGSMCGRNCNGHWGWTDGSHTGMELLGEYRTKCPYGNCETGCVKTLAKDALALLREQEPRMMTLEEVKAFDWDRCYLEEERLPGKEYRAVCGDHTLTCITWPCVASMQMRYGDESYGKKWRCWSAEPSDEQRKRAKWDG